MGFFFFRTKFRIMYSSRHSYNHHLQWGYHIWYKYNVKFADDGRCAVCYVVALRFVHLSFFCGLPCLAIAARHLHFTTTKFEFMNIEEICRFCWRLFWNMSGFTYLPLYTLYFRNKMARGEKKPVKTIYKHVVDKEGLSIVITLRVFL